MKRVCIKVASMNMSSKSNYSWKLFRSVREIQEKTGLLLHFWKFRVFSIFSKFFLKKTAETWGLFCFFFGKTKFRCFWKSVGVGGFFTNDRRKRGGVFYLFFTNFDGFERGGRGVFCHPWLTEAWWRFLFIFDKLRSSNGQKKWFGWINCQKLNFAWKTIFYT